MFHKIIIDDAQRVPELISLLALAKGCKKVYLIGDDNMPNSKKSIFQSETANLSLFSRLAKEGKKKQTFFSEF